MVGLWGHDLDPRVSNVHPPHVYPQNLYVYSIFGV